MNHRIDLALAQHRGLLTRAQQDALLVAGAVLQSSDLRTHPPVSEGQNGLCAVADGVAISPCPQRASRAVLEALYEIGPRHDDVLQDGWIGPRLIRRHVHPALCRALAGNRRTHGSACTLALLQWRAGRFSVLNVGDSRVYRIDREGRWQQLSRDHTYFNSMVERGEVAADQSVGQLYQDLEHMLIADEAEEDFAIHWRLGDWAPGDTVLVCTDGLHDTLGQQALEAFYRAERPLAEQAAAYLDAVLDAGAPDNVSLILGRIAGPV